MTQDYINKVEIKELVKSCLYNENLIYDEQTLTNILTQVYQIGAEEMKARCLAEMPPIYDEQDMEIQSVKSVIHPNQ